MHAERWQEWAWRWASAARLAGEGRVGNLLADLAEDAPRARTAVLLSLPVAATEAALGLPAEQLPAALERLCAAGLLSYALGGADPEHAHADITLHPPPAGRDDPRGTVRDAPVRTGAPAGAPTGTVVRRPAAVRRAGGVRADAHHRTR